MATDTTPRLPKTVASELLPPGYGVNAAGDVVKMPDSTEKPDPGSAAGQREKRRLLGLL